jgi:hypothetical protein
LRCALPDDTAAALLSSDGLQRSGADVQIFRILAGALSDRILSKGYEMIAKRTCKVPALMATGFVVLAGCGGSSDSPDAGELSLKITDMPIDDAEEVVVVFSGVELKHAGGPPFSIDFCEPDDPNDRHNCKSIDLKKLQDGVTDDLLTGETVDAGRYQWMRLKVIAEPEVNDASYIVLRNATTSGMFPLYAPSGAETDLKLVRPFVVAQGGITRLVADFGVRKSVLAPPPGIAETNTNYVLKPTIRLMDELDTGTIEGQVDLDALAAEQGIDTTTDPCKGGVYLFNGFAVTPDDMDTDGTAGDLDDPVVYDSVAVDPTVRKVKISRLG